MKSSTKRIVETFPKFKGRLKAYANIDLVSEALKDLTEVEATFLKLAWFFEAPEYESFNIRWLYESLDDDWLEFALEIMVHFFRKDTYLIQKPTLSVLRDPGENYFNQKQFADFLSEKGLHYDKRKLNVYYSRGKLPVADIELAGTPYWNKSTIEEYCQQEKSRLKKD